MVLVAAAIVVLVVAGVNVRAAHVITTAGIVSAAAAVIMVVAAGVVRAVVIIAGAAIVSADAAIVSAGVAVRQFVLTAAPVAVAVVVVVVVVVIAALVRGTAVWTINLPAAVERVTVIGPHGRRGAVPLELRIGSASSATAA